MRSFRWLKQKCPLQFLFFLLIFGCLKSSACNYTIIFKNTTISLKKRTRSLKRIKKSKQKNNKKANLVIVLLFFATLVFLNKQFLGRLLEIKRKVITITKVGYEKQNGFLCCLFLKDECSYLRVSLNMLDTPIIQHCLFCSHLKSK